ncbi:MAG: sugar ABC transporter permease, partial [Agathobacter sp.]|nr:sugar ABC transporter permease [Agathobacter sp.]
INNYFPMFGIFIAFKKVQYSVGIWGSDWVGFDNFKYLFTTQDAWIMTRNTLLYNAAFIIVGNVVGLLLGIMLYEIISKAWQKIFQTTILLPQLVSMVIVAYVVYGFLSKDVGFINNQILGKENAIDFYTTRKFWPWILDLVNTWKQMGYNAIIYLSAIAGIDRSLYEAARVDGSSKRQQIFRITIPMLKSTVITLLIMQVGRIFYSDFGLFLQVPMSSGVLFNVTQTIDTYVYRALMTLNQIGKASAASVYQSVVGFITVAIVNGIIRKVDRENAMF